MELCERQDFSVVTNYYEFYGYGVAFLKISDRLRTLEIIYNDLKIIDSELLKKIPERKVYLRIDKYNNTSLNQDVLKAAQYFEAFLYSLSAFSIDSFYDLHLLNTKYYFYINMFFPVDKTLDRQTHIRNLEDTLNQTFKYDFDTLEQFSSNRNMQYIEYILSNTKKENGYDILKSNFDILEHKLLILETTVYIENNDTQRINLYNDFDISNETILAIKPNIEKYNLKDNDKIINKNNNDVKNSSICCACLENQADCLYLSCKHLCICNQCYQKNITHEAKKKCPICRTYGNIIQVNIG